jgi:hypothetical protein
LPSKIFKKVLSPYPPGSGKIAIISGSHGTGLPAPWLMDALVVSVEEAAAGNRDARA